MAGSMRFNHREYSHIVAALRFWQANREDVREELVDIATDGGQPLMTDQELDALVDRFHGTAHEAMAAAEFNEKMAYLSDLFVECQTREEQLRISERMHALRVEYEATAE